MIVLGILLGNGIALWRVRKKGLDQNDLFILEGYVLLGAILGAKLLYLVTAIRQIQWNQIGNLEYLNQLMQGGFVFYGGLFGGLLALLLAAKIHKIDGKVYLRECIFLIPLMHGFGRVGCHMAGCCYGCRYHGPFAVVYPADSMALSGVPLFPVQLVEAGLLLLLAVVVFYTAKSKWSPVIIYFMGYAVIRFVTEFFRGDVIRGHLAWFSTSQWISMAVFLLLMGWGIIDKNRRKS